MTTWRWLRDRLLPELIHLNPMVAMAFYQSVAMDSADEAETGAPSALVSRSLRSPVLLDLVDVSRPAPVRP
jgi:hypothetical protein